MNQPRIYNKAQLKAVLERACRDPDHLIIGEESYSGKRISNCISRFSKVTGGHIPGIIGTDLWMLPESVEEIQIWVDEIADYCAGGGIFTTSHHFANPSGNLSTIRARTGITNKAPWGGCLGYEHSKEGYAKVFLEIVTDGTKLNLAFRNLLDRDAAFFRALQERDIPILWRPFHELNSSSFWWCAVQQNRTDVIVDPVCIKNLWIYIYEYFTKVKGLDRLLWVYSASNWDPQYAIDCYPGDEYVDIVGVDWYTECKDDLIAKQVYEPLWKMTPEKIHAIPEFGFARAAEQKESRYHGEDMLDDMVKVKQKNKYPIAYVMTWSTPWNLDNMGNGEALMNSEFALGQAELAKWFSECEYA